MKKYHFYVSKNFVGDWLVLERGKGNYFCVSFPTKYCAQKVAKWLWKHWKKNSPYLEILKAMVCSPSYRDWKKLNNLMLSYSL